MKINNLNINGLYPTEIILRLLLVKTNKNYDSSDILKNNIVDRKEAFLKYKPIINLPRIDKEDTISIRYDKLCSTEIEEVSLETDIDLANQVATWKQILRIYDVDYVDDNVKDIKEYINKHYIESGLWSI